MVDEGWERVEVARVIMNAGVVWWGCRRNIEVEEIEDGVSLESKVV